MEVIKMKKLTIIILAIMLFSMFAGIAASWPAKLTVRNYTGSKVYIKLSNKYYLPARTGVSVWDIKRGVYNSTVTACGESTAGIMDMSHNLKLTFVECPRMANPYKADGKVRDQFLGEPSMEKVSPELTPGVKWRYLY